MDNPALAAVKHVEERGKTYGPPGRNHGTSAVMVEAYIQARIDRQVQLCQQQGKEFSASMIRISPEDLCLMYALQKISRLANGTHADSIEDVCGYMINIAMLDDHQRNENPDGTPYKDSSNGS